MLRRSDFPHANPALADVIRAAAVAGARNRSIVGFAGTQALRRLLVQQKYAFQIQHLSDDILLRHAATNLSHALPDHVPVVSRELIVRNLAAILGETVPYRVYRLDVASFFESLSPALITGKLRSDRRVDPFTKRLVASFLEDFATTWSAPGIPRGVAISSVLAEFVMASFDEAVKNIEGVFFFARYVDDIVVVTSGAEDPAAFKALLASLLPAGLSFNQAPDKFDCKTFLVAKPTKTPGAPQSISFLGYEISVFDVPKNAERKCRPVRVDISLRKFNRLKKRIARSFIDCANSGDMSLLLQRIQYLTSNYSIWDFDLGRKKLAGIYYSQPNLSTASVRLAELDAYLRREILKPAGRAFSHPHLHLTAGEKRRLLGSSFRSGYELKRYVNFSTHQIREIQGCWRYD